LRLKIGTRVFAPRWFTSLVTLVLLILLVNLGRWQLHRADEKRALFTAFAAGSDTTQAIAADTAPLPRYQHARATGRYDSAHQFLLDSMIAHDGRVGYFVITPFQLLDGAWLLVNRGWVPPAADRDEHPDVAVDQNLRVLRGRADLLPRPGIRMGTLSALQPPFPIVANYPTFAQIVAVLGHDTWSRAAPLVLLDAREPQGYLRAWQAPGFAPQRHIAYAVQWFGLAAALAVIYVVTNLKA
jgi:surfeit locus 1 family protein